LRCGVRLNSSLFYSGALPKLAGHLDRVDASLLPPGSLVADAMQRAMMRATERDCELIAGFAPKRPRLHKSDVMGI
jgi:hypothetical protein